jgi:CRP/FNR family transcriptional regulator, anaerobic regulatory protein
MIYLFTPKLYLMKEKTDMLAPLIEMLSDINPISKALEDALVNGFEINKKEKNEVLLMEGNVCKNLWFLVNGLLRSYHDIDEKEVTSRIMFTNHIVIAPGSFFMQTPATESIQALVDCEVATMSFTTLQKIYAFFPEFNLHTRIITEQYFYKTEQRLYMLRKHDAGAKYAYFLENYETYLKNIPQKYIASFLNIAPETLSRVRNKLGK